MPYDPHKHHRRSIRLKDFDYSQPGGYFITICVRDRRCLFGEVIDAEMKTSRVGEIVKQCWNNIPDKYQNVETDEFVVMPNHVHGIIIINDDAIPNVGAMSRRPDSQHESSGDNESILIGATQRRPYKITLGKIVAFFKYESTKKINEINNSPGTPIWQRNYYERIIRGEEDLNAIRRYILSNPSRWSQDEESEPTPR